MLDQTQRIEKPFTKYRARVVFYGPDRGGRGTCPSSGYHPQLDLGWVQTSCVLTAADARVELFNFDKEHEVEVRPITPQCYGGDLRGGEIFLLREGAKLVGECRIDARLA